ncbi:MAG: hypothetical protein AABY22_35750 [Nanoarchaeota archaeon]
MICPRCASELKCDHSSRAYFCKCGYCITDLEIIGLSKNSKEALYDSIRKKKE